MNTPQRPSLAGAAPRPDGVQIRLAANPAADWLARIDEGLDAYNLAHAPLHQVQPLVCVAQDAAGELLGGAVARSWGECCELQQLWVAEAWRRQGLGRLLVQAVEAEARLRGCRRVYLETFSFQAPALYLTLGYAVTHDLPGFGEGIHKLLMLRELT